MAANPKKRRTTTTQSAPARLETALPPQPEQWDIDEALVMVKAWMNRPETKEWLKDMASK